MLREICAIIGVGSREQQHIKKKNSNKHKMGVPPYQMLNIYELLAFFLSHKHS